MRALIQPALTSPLQKSSARILAEDRVVELMAREYFTFLGTLSSSSRSLPSVTTSLWWPCV